MKRIFNIKELKERRRKLRNNQTVEEKRVWEYIRKKRICGIQFYRQYGVGPYIADFYAPKIKLCIEIDGDQHYTSEGKMYDKERDDYMKSLGIEVLRYKNSEVINTLSDVLDIIEDKIIKINPSIVSLSKKGRT